VETGVGHDQQAAAKNPLSAREAVVLGLIGHGLSNKRIARSLGIAPETVKSHAKNILAKLNAQTRAEAVALAAGWNLT
jgi:LuxR family transcriptional regulator, maltose regulon positive regulatory protein